MADSSGTCERCGAGFSATKSTKRFCSEICRRRTSKARSREQNRDKINAAHRAWRAANPERARMKDRARRERELVPETNTRRNSRLFRKYGITLARKLEMAEEQEGLCAICGRIPTETYGLVTDHCHTSGRVRGLLCHKCNTALGLMGEDPGRLLAAVNYLHSHKVAMEP